MLTDLSFKIAVQVTSQSFTTYERDLEASLDRPWLVVYDSGKLFIGRFMVEMDVMMSPFMTMT